MNLKNCTECGTLMVEHPSGLCPKCLEIENEAEDKVAEFLRSTRHASVVEIEEATGVAIKIIMRMLKRGRIFNSDNVVAYPCERCGNAITEGHLCGSCSRDALSLMQSDKPAPPKKEEKPKTNDRVFIKGLLDK
jgi:hypothetical protein